jgi:hypothetical protein
VDLALKWQLLAGLNFYHFIAVYRIRCIPERCPKQSDALMFALMFSPENYPQREFSGAQVNVNFTSSPFFEVTV